MCLYSLLVINKKNRENSSFYEYGYMTINSIGIIYIHVQGTVVLLASPAWLPL